MIESSLPPQPLYPVEMGFFEKIETIAKEISVDEVIADQKLRDQLKAWEEQGYGKLPVCMAKRTGFTTDPNKRGAPMAIAFLS